jgi:hypothetical protein
MSECNQYRSVTIAVTAAGFFIIAFFFSMVMNQLVHAMFPPETADYINEAASAIQIVLILYGTGFMHRMFK